jgi:hypothetical protein
MRYTSFMCGDDANVRVGNCRPPITYGTTEYAEELGCHHLVEDQFLKTNRCDFGHHHRWEGEDIGLHSIHDKEINP